MSQWLFNGIVAVLFGIFFWSHAAGYADYQMKNRNPDPALWGTHRRWAQAVAVVFVGAGVLMMVAALLGK